MLLEGGSGLIVVWKDQFWLLAASYLIATFGVALNFYCIALFRG